MSECGILFSARHYTNELNDGNVLPEVIAIE